MNGSICPTSIETTGKPDLELKTEQGTAKQQLAKLIYLIKN